MFTLRHSNIGIQLPSCVKPGPVYVKHYNRTKNNLRGLEAELIEANSYYVHVRLGDGKELLFHCRI